MDESFRLRIITFTLLIIIFILEIVQMNLNIWADSWGAGCVFASVGSVLFQQWYAVRRHKERNMDMYIPSIKASLIHRRGFIISMGFIGTVMGFQFLEIIIWPTAFKDSRYYCEGMHTGMYEVGTPIWRPRANRAQIGPKCRAKAPDESALGP